MTNQSTGGDDNFLGFHIPPNTLLASFEDKIEIWSAPLTQAGILFGRGEERGNQVIHRMAISLPLTPEHADWFLMSMKKKGKDKFTKEDLVAYLIMFLEFSSKEIRGMGIAPEHARDTTSLRLEEMKKGPIQIHF